MILSAVSTRDHVADYVSAVFFVYFVLVFARVLLTWIPRIPYNRYLRAVIGFVEEVVDPYLNLFRRVIPPLGGSIPLDLSPILAIVVLFLVEGVVVGVIRG